MNIAFILSLLAAAGCTTVLAAKWPEKDGRPCRCTRLDDPVCASDGQDYPNPDCAKHCGKVSSFRRGTCDEPSPCACTFNIATVCARRPDGTLADFDNRCVAECQNGARFVSDGACPAKPVQPLPDFLVRQLNQLRVMERTREKKEAVCFCNYIYQPVCGLKNGEWREYGNQCTADCAKVERSKSGPCKKVELCACGRNWSPVCARKSDGTLKTYANQCQADCEDAVTVNSGPCEAKPDNSLPNLVKKSERVSCACTREFRPVCGEKNGVRKTYSNRCVAQCHEPDNIEEGPCEKKHFKSDRDTYPNQLPSHGNGHPAQLPHYHHGDRHPAQLPVFPEDRQPAQLPVFPDESDLVAAQLPVFPDESDESDLVAAQLPVFPGESDESDLVAAQLPVFPDESDESDLVAAQLPVFPSLFKRKAWK